ncbi:hypothetical protein L0U88_01250 [Flavihumibacter sp. RY-1]|uniref:Outer membrane beta-barrel porin/alpha-amylase n=1 Tax=Flavihumibacter fluminis TaxID=2909236 RepID=A0ABS9BD97_9BACT|nr:hypothetical protein [Flavihumibacter fluminis]MCF1713250.1 hypothetical protein [Flavihumibacter fluminis]
MKSLLTLPVILLLTSAAYAQDHSGSEAEELAKKLANPVANLISLPIQTNTDFGAGINNGSRMVINVQPVIPFSVSKNLNLITRWIVPVTTQHNYTGPSTQQTGIGDAVISGFLSPKNSKLTWGAGPVFVVPIATNQFLGAKKWAVGPTLVALSQKNGWTYGGLVNHLVSIAGDKNRSAVNATFLNPFLTYNWKSGAGITANFEYTRDWENDINVLLFVPTASAVTKFGSQTVSFGIGPRIHLSPDNKPDFGIRAGISLIFPK